MMQVYNLLDPNMRRWIKTDLVKILISVSLLSCELGAKVQGCLLALHYLCLMIMLMMVMMMVIMVIMMMVMVVIMMIVMMMVMASLAPR